MWPPVLSLLGALALPAGSYLGRTTFGVLARPTQQSAMLLVLLMGVGVPLLSGAIDLYLRRAIP
jgi:hypothetical protein